MGLVLHAETINLSKPFAAMLRERQVTLLDDWFRRVEESSSGVFRMFARSLRRDEAAIRAAFTEVWSTGPVEGHISRLKSLKRQMYGRAKLDLLEARFLHAA